MAGIYVHIPFCKSKCPYCNFFSLASRKYKLPFLQALSREVELTSGYLEGQPVTTVYFGGGTPSVYPPAALQQILETIANTHKVIGWNSHGLIPGSSTAHDGMEDSRPPAIPAEITLEINPDDVTVAFVGELKQTGFNRISLGVQSFDMDDLRYLQRTHSADCSMQAVRLLKEAGYENISIDLIYGIPGSSAERWHRTLETTFALDVSHISAYALTVEPGTVLSWMIERQRSAPTDEELLVSQYHLLTRMAGDHGFEQYEISNFARPGWHSKHNTGYWQGTHYLGLGPSAHSYNGIARRWNGTNLNEYLHGVTEGRLKFEEETLTPEQKYNEYVMTSLRTMWGCDSNKINKDFGSPVYDFFRKQVAPSMQQELVQETSGIYFLTGRGKLFADRIASDLFLV